MPARLAPCGGLRMNVLLVEAMAVRACVKNGWPVALAKVSLAPGAQQRTQVVVRRGLDRQAALVAEGPA